MRERIIYEYVTLPLWRQSLIFFMYVASRNIIHHTATNLIYIHTYILSKKLICYYYLFSIFKSVVQRLLPYNSWITWLISKNIYKSKYLKKTKHVLISEKPEFFDIRRVYSCIMSVDINNKYIFI